ncbi:MAG: hypothetical protein K9N51_10215 [Candidatus Pacebacteria bacterium]|nr:hypothetical protein [Candidatus Paceibacterota bacterium]
MWIKRSYVRLAVTGLAAIICSTATAGTVFQASFDGTIEPVVGESAAFTSGDVEPEYRKAHSGRGVLLPKGAGLELTPSAFPAKGAMELCLFMKSTLPGDENRDAVAMVGGNRLFLKQGMLCLTNGVKALRIPVYEWGRGEFAHVFFSWADDDIGLWVND